MPVNLSKFPVMQFISGIKLNAVNLSVNDKWSLIQIAPGSNLCCLFTQNKFCAAPIIIAKQHFKQRNPRCLLINSGNANACTGPLGITNAKIYGGLVSKKLQCKTNEILIFSTGIVGEHLPIDKMIEKIDKKEFKFKSSWDDAASAIMTTDKFKKIIKKSFVLKNQKIRMNAICKGAGMIEPNMATTLSFMEINVKISQNLLSKLIKEVTKNSFNKISVDGDMSTNDSFAIIATGENSSINFLIHFLKNVQHRKIS